MRPDPWRDSCPDFPDLMSRLSRRELLARICNLGLNPDAARPVGRFMSRLSIPYEKTFNNQTLGVNVQCNLGPNPDAARPWRDSCPYFPDLMSRLSPLEHSAQICNLGLNLDAARPLARFLSRLFRPYDKTIKVETLGATLQFGSKSDCAAILGTIVVQTVQNLCADFSDSNC